MTENNDERRARPLVVDVELDRRAHRIHAAMQAGRAVSYADRRYLYDWQQSGGVLPKPAKPGAKPRPYSEVRQEYARKLGLPANPAPRTRADYLRHIAESIE